MPLWAEERPNLSSRRLSFTGGGFLWFSGPAWKQADKPAGRKLFKLYLNYPESDYGSLEFAR